jgi:hypothetical protein
MQIFSHHPLIDELDRDDESYNGYLIIITVEFNGVFV